MKITETRVRLVKKDDGKLKAVASITIDECFVVLIYYITSLIPFQLITKKDKRKSAISHLRFFSF